MSAGGNVAHVNRGFVGLAPKFAAAVIAALEECNAAGLDAIAFETTRSDALAAVYYTRGRPPSKEYPKPVTNASTAAHSWHGYGLAVDVISASKEWDAGDAWFAKVAEVFKRHGCKWGGDWKSKDRPHFQWAKCKDSPSDLARSLLRNEGVEAVWRACGAAE